MHHTQFICILYIYIWYELMDIYIYQYMYSRWLGGCFTFVFSGLKVSSIQWYQGGVDFLYFGESGDGPKATWLVAVLNERVCRNLFDVFNFFILYMKFVYLFQVKIWNKYVLVNCWDLHPYVGRLAEIVVVIFDVTSCDLIIQADRDSIILLCMKGCLSTFKILF